MSEKKAEKTMEKVAGKPIEEKFVEKKRAEKPKKKEKGAYSRYKIEGKGVVRLLPFCERCGPGYFMADHGNRYTCGYCGFTRYRQTETNK